ncbi:hypothetical protein KC367_g1353 [Hortaea werneckii]|nr:hypothetical protein KC367_g1353 [Hortaea werneckii]
MAHCMDALAFTLTRYPFLLDDQLIRVANWVCRMHLVSQLTATYLKALQADQSNDFSDRQEFLMMYIDLRTMCNYYEQQQHVLFPPV